MKRNTIVFVVLALCALFTSCKKEASPVNIIVNQYGTSMTVPTGTIVAYHVKTFSEKNIVHKVTVTSLDNENGLVTLWDTILDVKTAEFDFMYKAPLFLQDSLTNVKLTFTATANTGDESRMVHNLVVSKGGTLASYDGIIMYSALSNNRNGFNLNNAQTIYTSTVDSSSIDIYDYFIPGTSDSSLLCREWRSKTSLLFVRFNDFDFAGATRTSLHNAYKAGAKYTSITNIMLGDVILVGRDDTELGAIQITAVYDDEGTDNDRYIFNFKKP